MPTLTDGVLFGLGILVVDFLAWRFMDRKSEQMRLAFSGAHVRSFHVCPVPLRA